MLSFLRGTFEGSVKRRRPVARRRRRRRNESLSACQNWLRDIKRDTNNSIYEKKINFITFINMAHYRAPDPKREQFRRYLEKAGVVDSLTSVLVALYETQDKPSNALEFVKEHLGAADLTSVDTEALQQEAIDLRQRCARLAEENKDLKTRLLRYEPEDGATAD